MLQNREIRTTLPKIQSTMFAKGGKETQNRWFLNPLLFFFNLMG